MLRKLVKALTSRRLLKGVLTGVGGGVLTAVGWKLGTDVYEGIKRRVQDGKTREAPSAEDDVNPLSG